MPIEIVHVINQRDRDLHPLVKRKDELIAELSSAAHAGEHLSDEKRAELRDLVNQIAAVHIRTAERGDGADYTVPCVGIGGACTERIDTHHEGHVIADIHSVRIFRPDAEPNDRNVWIHPPNLGTLVLCEACWAKVEALFASQRVEVETL